jgi:hypothetical protein
MAKEEGRRKRRKGESRSGIKKNRATTNAFINLPRRGLSDNKAVKIIVYEVHKDAS